MKPIFPLLAGLPHAVLVSFLTGSLASAGCAAPAPPGGVAPASAASATVMTRGGVSYNPALPLKAIVTPKFDQANPPAEVLTYALTFQGGDNAPVPAFLTLPTKATGKLPTVLLLHGLGGKKEDVYLLASALSRKGYASLAIDVAGHAGRPSINGKALSEMGPSELRTLVGQTVVDLRRATDYLVSRPDIDPQRIGFVGVSLGGIIGGVFAGDEPRLKAVALWAAGGDWGKILTQTTESHAQQFRAEAKGTSLSADDLDKTLSEVDPLEGVKRAPARPMLFLYGDKDTIVPTATEDALYAAAKDPKKRQVFHGGHIPDLLGMVTTTMTWLDENVKK